ncbi:MAG TPA: hypothetical protein VGN88_03860 [Phycisphaerae bacterium]
MNKILSFTLTRQRTKWTLSFRCPACGTTNEQDPIPNTSTMTCAQCQKKLDGTDSELTLIDKTLPSTPHS